MSQDDVPDDAAAPLLDFSKYVPQHFQPPGLVSDLQLVDVWQEGAVLSVVFDGRPHVRPGRFGVRIPTPVRSGDERWVEFPVVEDEPAEEWLKMAIILELMEVYDTTAQSSQVQPDSDGIIWLS